VPNGALVTPTPADRGSTAGASGPLLPALAARGDEEAIRFGERAVTYRELADAGAHVADRIADAPRVGVWAAPALETCVAVVGALSAGVPVVPINPRSGERELAHIVSDSAPALVLAAPGAELPGALAGVARIDVDATARGGHRAGEPSPEAPAIIVYTSGTTGPPKGVVLPRRAIASNLDALAAAWEWTAADVLVHALPLFHVHGLVLGLLGPLRLGGAVHHLGRFTSTALASELAGPATMMFGVPTMYHRLADDAGRDPAIARGLAAARLLVSGSAALPASEHERIERITGQRVVERYGMTETLMTCAVRAAGDRRPGTVGPPVDGVDVRLVDDDGTVVETSDDATVGEVQVRGPNLFLEYRNRPDATAEAMRDGWFATGDVATRAADGHIRIVGRRATDLINSGGFKIGAGEIESVLLEHRAVAEVAVTGEPDPDLGERVVAWVVPAGGRRPTVRELSDHVAEQLAPHKRPRVVRYLDALPRNEMGKVLKTSLADRPADQAGRVP
jgi:malonyl-CoA/methylmalonyl-CoA synthetase